MEGQTGRRLAAAEGNAISTSRQVAELSGDMAGHLGGLAQQISLVEEQTRMFARQDQASSGFRSGVASKVRRSEAAARPAD